MRTTAFWIFGILQSISLGVIIFLIFRSLNIINGGNVIGLDTQSVLSIVFPLFLLLTEYIIYSKKQR
ncbi:hypothetical protein [Prolixibacter denitrificans]|uniref:Uncharacterized protein n=1 Tax=Prolixibacter denitrificans TaxID=1541063 RepID=A0A2P8CAE5_9BACT|nr:hypothetical protein [Prolixibacter denitrificans]PSK81927.1 hypothetical protein CLV93_10736 [Prolixibacter denitrificans]GET22524.1 hypothetical protein JCM18694_27700 [Prolixibacter denitrificans]